MAIEVCKGFFDAMSRVRESGPALSRRALVASFGLGTLAWAGQGTALRGVVSSPQRPDRRLVVIFLRGGADGLTLVPPVFEDAYYRARPGLSIAKPNDRSQSVRTIDLDGRFGLHPSLAPILPLYREGKLRITHAVGSQDNTRSHFEAMAAMEHGAPREGVGPTGGWLARYLEETAHPADSPLRAVALGNVMPQSLRGAAKATQLESLKDYRLREDITAELRKMYGVGKDLASEAGRQTLDALAALGAAKPTEGGHYPDTALGKGLRDAAALLRTDAGVEAITLDHGVWDTHVAQGKESGWMPTLMDELARSLAAFVEDLGSEFERTRIVVISEFGRRVAENSGLGTDHGRGTAMFTLGGNVEGGVVETRWPGLRPEDLEGPGDLKVTTDYREILTDALPMTVAGVFPGWA
ncbi:DUF1501 domain-containing protein [soil metagenome]